MSDTELSYTDRARAEAVSIVRKGQCCRRSFLLSYLWGAGSVCDGSVYLKAKGEWTCEYLCKLIKEQFGRDAVVRHSGKSGQVYEISFISRQASEMITSPEDAYEHIKKCPSCMGAMLSGLLCSCVSINDPRADYYLSVRVEPRYKNVITLLLECADIPVSYRINGKKGVFYLRASSAIEDFLALCGMQRLLFDFMNCKIEKDFRNNTNRALNIEMNNIQKSLGAAQKYITAIKWLDERDRLVGLNSELYEAARLRVENPDCSLSALGAMLTPPVSKSGIVHRLNRIYEIYEDAKKKQDE